MTRNAYSKIKTIKKEPSTMRGIIVNGSFNYNHIFKN